MLDLICATRLNAEDFWATSALGQSLRRLSHDRRLKPHIAFENRRGLPAVYNERIAAADASPILVFIHDDVWLDDHFFFEHITTAVSSVDIAGVAGNRRRVPGQPSWAFRSPNFDWDDPQHLSGTVGHGPDPFGKLACFGPVPASCELLDGVLLATRRDLLREKQVGFDEQFDFHFYDLDFCRSARQADLRLATWPVAITHQSRGNAGSPDWVRNYRAYLKKWGS